MGHAAEQDRDGPAEIRGIHKRHGGGQAEAISHGVQWRWVA